MKEIGEDLSDEDLLTLVAAADDIGLAKGEEPGTRAFQAVLRVLQEINPGGSTTLTGDDAPPIVRRIHAAIEKLYRPQDLRARAVHLGVFMFRDFFFRFHIPIVFGSPQIEPIKHIDMSEMQKRWMYSAKSDWAAYHDQFFDLFDFGYGFMELGHDRPLNDKTISYIDKCRFQLQAAAAVLTTAYDYRGATQSALLSVELALKAGLLDHQVNERSLKKIGHDLVKLADEYGSKSENFDTERVAKVIETLPNYVPNRYSAEQPERIEAGQIVMGAQYIASEVVRQLTNRDIRSDNSGFSSRSYPTSS